MIKIRIEASSFSTLVRAPGRAAYTHACCSFERPSCVYVLLDPTLLWTFLMCVSPCACLSFAGESRIPQIRVGQREEMAFEDPKFPVTDPAPGMGTVFGNLNATDVATVVVATAGSAAWCFKGGEVR